MKSQKSKKSNQDSKKLFARQTEPSGSSIVPKLSLFDHVKHIRGVQSPDYFDSLSEENKKSFNHFMLLRALSMDDDVLPEMAFLYRYFDKIPSPQFYKLLIGLVPRGTHWVPWIKAKVVKHSPDLLNLVSKHYQISKRQANEYINVLVATEEGLLRLIDLCKMTGLDDSEVEKLFDKKES